MTEEKQDPNQEQNTKNVAKFLFGIIIGGSASLVFKMAWNLGLASLFPDKIPQIGFMHALTWLTMLYIMARVVSAGYMAEVERTINILVEEVTDAVKNFEKLARVVSVKKNEESYDSSDLN